MNKMTMSYEIITPEMAKEYLKTKKPNRRLSPGTVTCYANDMLAKNWDMNNGNAITFDKNNRLIDGQHRLSAIVKSRCSIGTWVCRNASEDGVYDANRPRSCRDQITISKPNLEKIYSSSIFLSVARCLLAKRIFRSKISANALIDFIEANKEILDGFFMELKTISRPKIGISVVSLSLFMAYANGVAIEDIKKYFDVLTSGFSSEKREIPIIVYRNYLMSFEKHAELTKEEIIRCQYSLKKYLEGSGTKRVTLPDEFIWGFPDMEKQFIITSD